jgi:hypothetical protein
MNSALKNVGVLAILLGVLLLGGLYIGYLPQISSFVYHFANPASEWVFILDLLVLPFAVSRRLRPLVGVVLHVSSYLFGIVLWTFSAMFTYAFWGFLGLFLGLIWVGVGVVPIAVITAVLHREWLLTFMLLGDLVLVFGCRTLGIVFLTSFQRRRTMTGAG